MDIQTITKKYAYKIEPKPEGGFIARPSDPTVPPIEGATREEIQRKIRETVAAGLAQAFPGLKIPLQTRNGKLEFQIERKPEGGFSVHSTEVGPPSMPPAAHERVDHLAEMLLGMVDKRFPELSKALAEQATSEEVQIITEQRTEKTGTGFGMGKQDLLPTPPPMNSEPNNTFANWTGGAKTSVASDNFSTISNTPIIPQAGNNRILRILLIALAIAGLVYFLMLHR